MELKEERCQQSTEQPRELQSGQDVSVRHAYIIMYQLREGKLNPDNEAYTCNPALQASLGYTEFRSILGLRSKMLYQIHPPLPQHTKETINEKTRCTLRFLLFVVRRDG